MFALVIHFFVVVALFSRARCSCDYFNMLDSQSMLMSLDYSFWLHFITCEGSKPQANEWVRTLNRTDFVIHFRHFTMEPRHMKYCDLNYVTVYVRRSHYSINNEWKIVRNKSAQEELTACSTKKSTHTHKQFFFSEICQNDEILQWKWKQWTNK